MLRLVPRVASLFDRCEHSCEKQTSTYSSLGSVSSHQCGRMKPMGPLLTSKHKWKPLECTSGRPVTRNTDLNPIPFWPGTHAHKKDEVSKNKTNKNNFFLLSLWCHKWLSLGCVRVIYLIKSMSWSKLIAPLWNLQTCNHVWIMPTSNGYNNIIDHRRTRRSSPWYTSYLKIGKANWEGMQNEWMNEWTFVKRISTQ
jgi:hypothetical protein